MLMNWFMTEGYVVRWRRKPRTVSNGVINYLYLPEGRENIKYNSQLVNTYYLCPSHFLLPFPSFPNPFHSSFSFLFLPSLIFPLLPYLRSLPIYPCLSFPFKPLSLAFNGVRGYNPRKILGIADAPRWALAHVGNKTQQFNTIGVMPVNFSSSVESVKMEILQVGENLNEQ